MGTTAAVAMGKEAVRGVLQRVQKARKGTAGVEMATAVETSETDLQVVM